MITAVVLKLGDRCNFSCMYCMQNQNTPTAYTKEKSKLCSTEVKNALLELQPQLIRLYGGEPLLYWDTFMDMAKFTKENIPNCEIRTITNGSLLDDNKVEFLNEHNVMVCVSHDGRFNNITRKGNVFENKEILRCFLNLKRKSINTVLCPLNFDVYKDVWGYFDELFGERISIWTGTVKNVGKLPIFEITGKDKQHFKKTLRTIGDNFRKAIERNDWKAREVYFFNLYMNALQNKLSANMADCGLGCGVGDYILPIDIEGNIYQCQNSCHRIGHIAEWQNLKEFQYPHITKTPYQEEHCGKCQYQGVCTVETCAICDDKAKETECFLRKSIFDELVYQLQKMNNLQVNAISWDIINERS